MESFSLSFQRSSCLVEVNGLENVCKTSLKVERE